MKYKLAKVGVFLVLLGTLLVPSILYDATHLAIFLGLNPMGGEAIVVLVGLGLIPIGTLLFGFVVRKRIFNGFKRANIFFRNQ